jgi:hypothetical protein
MFNTIVNILYQRMTCIAHRSVRTRAAAARKAGDFRADGGQIAESVQSGRGRHAEGAWLHPARAFRPGALSGLGDCVMPNTF